MRRFGWLLIFFLIVFCAQVQAQWSYLYIQGDKQLPFYVKLEGEMLPRYGKNYSIIPRLSAGPVHIEILFQQNLFPPQRYTINIPADGYRGFLLSKKDGNYALYDIQQHAYLYPGGQDLAVTSETAPVTDAPKQQPITAHEEPPLPQAKAEEAPPVLPKPPTPKNNDEPQFLDNIVLNPDSSSANSGSIRLQETDTPGATTAAAKNTNAEQPEVVLESNTAPIINSDCPAPMSEAAFTRMYRAASESDGGDKLISYLLKKIEDNCYTTRQVYQLANLMDEEALIFLYLKRVFPRVTDQHNFSLLEPHLFETEEWSKAFRSIH